MTSPLVSIVMATYRREDALKKSLQSLAEQTYKNIEILLVDDNADSQWNSKISKVVEAFRADHPNVKLTYVQNKTNLGSAETRNVGIRSAEGEYVTFLDDDDLYLPDKVGKQVEFMMRENCDYSITDLDLFNEKDKLVDRRIRTYVKKTDPDSLLRYHIKHHLTGTDTMMFRKAYLDKIGGFAPINVGDEFYLIQRAIDGKGKFGYLPQCHVKAYIHTGEGGLSSGDGKIRGENTLYEYKKQYFDRLSPEDRRYVKMRHHAVLAFAYVRYRKIFPALFHGMCSFFSAPINFFKMALGER